MMYIFLLSDEYPITKACSTLDPFFDLFWPCGLRNQFFGCHLMKNDKKLFNGEILHQNFSRSEATLKNLLKRPMFEPALVIEYLSQSRYKTISGIRLKNSIFESHLGKMLFTLVTLLPKFDHLNKKS